MDTCYRSKTGAVPVAVTSGTHSVTGPTIATARVACNYVVAALPPGPLGTEIGL